MINIKITSPPAHTQLHGRIVISISEQRFFTAAACDSWETEQNTSKAQEELSVPDQISRDFIFIFNKVYLPSCLSEALGFKCCMSWSRNYVSVFTQGRRYKQALPLLPHKHLKAVKNILTPAKRLHFCSTQTCKPGEPQVAGAGVGAGSWISAELTLTQCAQGRGWGRNNIKPPKNDFPER